GGSGSVTVPITARSGGAGKPARHPTHTPCPLCPCRIAVRSLGFQSRDGGSTPPRDTGRAGAIGLSALKLDHPKRTHSFALFGSPQRTRRTQRIGGLLGRLSWLRPDLFFSLCSLFSVDRKSTRLNSSH